MGNRRVRIAAGVLVAACCVGYRGAAQEPTAPTILAGASQSATSTAPKTAVFDRTFSINLRRVSLRAALSAVADAAHVEFTYSSSHVPVNKVVSLVAETITLRDALHVLLQGTGFEPVIAPTGAIGIVLAGSATPLITDQQGSAVLSGVVTDSGTGGPVPQASIHIEGTNLGAVTGADGRYKITDVPSGDHRVIARRVGYVAKSRTVTLVDGDTHTLNFDLDQPATKLDEVVTTALGDQRRYQVGNVVATINVDSLAPTAPVTSVTDLIAGRAPGVEVMESSGLVGSGEAIRIRGESSMLLQSDPILIVDGIRVDNTPGGSYNSFAGNFTQGYSPSPSRINDLDFTQIETINILKGPAATTEYGTDAANGVIVITTKRGNIGAPLWHASAEQAASVVPSDFPNYYYSWGHSSNGRDNPAACSIIPFAGGGYPAQYGIGGLPYTSGYDGGCTTDSVSAYNPLNHASTSYYGTGPSSRYDLDVSGGSDAIRYYLSAGMSNAVGGTHLPNVFRDYALSIGFPPSQIKSNSENARSVKANSNIKLGQTADVQINVAYTSTYQETPATGSLPLGLPVLAGSTYDYGYGSTSFNINTPLSMLGSVASQQTDGLTGGITANWRPGGWFVGHGTFGLQHESQYVQQINFPQSYQAWLGITNDGLVNYTNGGTDIYTVDLRGTATAALLRNLKSETSVGVQMVDTRSQLIGVEAGGLANGQLNPTQSPYATYPTFDQSRTATLGGYIEEDVSFLDRFFLTAALRVDAGSGFGKNTNSAEYPKATVSWIVFNNGPTTVRLRGALGGAGQQPPAGAALQTWSEYQTTINGVSLPEVGLGTPGTPGLQPERSLEEEGGFDINLWRNRVTLEGTMYTKTTTNAIYALPLGFEFEYLTQYVNLGEVRNTGIEGTLTASLIENRLCSWTVAINMSVNHNKLIHLAPGLQNSAQGLNVGGNQYFSAGYPLYAYFDYTTRARDVNRDGILEWYEVQMDTVHSFQGQSLPIQETSLSTHVGLWREVVSVGALFDWQVGFKLLDLTNEEQSDVYPGPQGRAENILGAPIEQQAQAYYGSVDYISGNFVRFRELNVTYSLPHSWARAIHVSNLSLTGAVRNLFLWTAFVGDPEVGGAGVVYQPFSNSQAVNNDIRQTNGNVPLMRSWTVRLNLGL